jgi:hypothetical protein
MTHRYRKHHGRPFEGQQKKRIHELLERYSSKGPRFERKGGPGQVLLGKDVRSTFSKWRTRYSVLAKRKEWQHPKSFETECARKLITVSLRRYEVSLSQPSLGPSTSQGAAPLSGSTEETSPQLSPGFRKVGER